MRIAICGSMSFAKEMLKVKSDLEGTGHIAFVAPDIQDCLTNPELSMDLEYCLERNLQKRWFDTIEKSDAILVLNYKRNGIQGYIGGATLMEIGVAQHLDKKIFLLNPLPRVEDLRYSLEVQLAKPIILDGDLSKIKQYA